MKKLILGLMILLCQSIYGQSVEDLISLAIERNPSIKSMELNYEAALKVADQVDDWADPMASIGIGVLPVQTRLGAQQFRLGVNQAIPWIGMLNAKSELANANAETIADVKEIKAIEIEYTIRKAYNMLTFLTNKQVIIAQKLEVLDVLEILAKSAVRSGKGKLSNVLFIERSRMDVISELSLILKQMDSPKIMINSFTGRAPLANINIENNDNFITENTEYLEFAMKNHPQYKVLESMKIASQKASDITLYDSKPKISVGLEYGWVSKRQDVDIPRNGRDMIMPMASISIPLNRSRFTAKRQQEAIKQEAIDASIQDYQERYSAEVRAAFSEIEYVEISTRKFQELRKITGETIELMRTEYASEGTRFEELLRLEMERINYELEIEKAKYQKALAISSLKKFL